MAVKLKPVPSLVNVRNAQLVKMLQGLLEQAERGEVVAMVAVGVRVADETFTAWSDINDLQHGPKLVFCCEDLKLDLLRKIKGLE